MSKQFHISYKYTRGNQTSSMGQNVYANSPAEAKEKFKEQKKHDQGQIQIISVREV